MSCPNDEEFPLLVEVLDEEDVSKESSLGEEVEEFLNDLSDDETEAIDSDGEVNKDIYELKALIAALKEGKE